MVRSVLRIGEAEKRSESGVGYPAGYEQFERGASKPELVLDEAQKRFSNAASFSCD